MSQNWSPKKANWVQRFSNYTVGLLSTIDALNDLCAEYDAMAYGQGGANQLTDADCQTILPASTAVLVSEAEGAIAGANAVAASVASVRGYLENMRP